MSGLSNAKQKWIAKYSYLKKPLKDVYVSRNVIEIGVTYAVLELNNETQATKKL